MSRIIVKPEREKVTRIMVKGFIIYKIRQKYYTDKRREDAMGWQRSTLTDETF
jgi:hypothetical protein